MRIDNSYLAGMGVGETRANLGIVSAGEKKDESAEPSSAISVHVPSSELVQLRQQLKAVPDTRPALLARIAQSLDSGAYTSPEAAARTAVAILLTAD